MADQAQKITQIITGGRILSAQLSGNSLNKFFTSKKKTNLITSFKVASLDTDFVPSEDLVGKHICYFLVKPDTLNGMDWNIPEEGEKNIHTFKGKPFVITSRRFIKDSPYGDKMRHPNMSDFKDVKPEWIDGLDIDSLEDMLEWQQYWRVADIVELIYDTEKESWKVIIKVLPEFENKQFPPYCSLTIFMNDTTQSNEYITDFTGVNLTGLEERPAYGEEAIQEGTCNGTTSECKTKFASSKSIFETSLKESKLKIAAMLSTDNPDVNIVKVHGKKKINNLKKN